ncbi:cytochrome P450 [Actinoplanes sp. TFC3]|uniref:cytochrome P450 family protein n=1 Tax=Actinoplanes sp. TFC3 TaxID=1710355 RepID=UPI00082B6AAD|nr:cytochrome P450 [Actinoplanes sp. TFC3]
MPNIDLAETGPDFYADPHPHYRALRESAGIQQRTTRLGEPFWLVLGYDDARAFLSDSRLSKSRVSGGHQQVIGQHLLDSDPPVHTRLRKLVVREFTRRRVENLRPRVEETTAGLLDDMVPRGRADLVDSLGFPLPMGVLCELLGIPAEDRVLFKEWTRDILAPRDPKAKPLASTALIAYLTDLIEQKRRGQPSDDLMHALLRTSTEDNDRLSPDELCAMIFILILAGHETTTNLLSTGTYALLRHPGQLAALRADPALIDGAVEEMLRFDSSVESGTTRYATEKIEYGDVVIEPGEMVLVSLASADRDPGTFERPDEFDIRRPPGPGHLAFGHGIHFCLGAPLARMQARIALNALVQRCPGLTLDREPEPSDWLGGIQVRGLQQLFVRW